MGASRWEELRGGPLIEIAKKLDNYEDYESFNLVCRSWYSSRSKFQGSNTTSQVPWLLLANREPCMTSYFTYVNQREEIESKPEPKHEHEHLKLKLFLLSSKRIREWSFRLPIELNCRDSYYCDVLSSHGWLLIVSKPVALASMLMVNPFRSGLVHDNYIQLPGPLSLGKLSNSGRVHKFVFSAACVVILYDYNKLASWTPGDDVWTRLNSENFGGVFDVTFFRGQFYAIGCSSILRFSPRGPGANDTSTSYSSLVQKLIRFSVDKYVPDYPGSRLFMAYMVVCSDKLLLVLRIPLYPEIKRYGHRPIYGTRGFKVFEVVLRHRVIIKEVNSLGNASLFVGYNHSFSIEIPSSCYYGFKPNCIYFTDDYNFQRHLVLLSLPKDMGVFNMADGSIEQQFQGLSPNFAYPPLWVQPCS